MIEILQQLRLVGLLFMGLYNRPHSVDPLGVLATTTPVPPTLSFPMLQPISITLSAYPPLESKPIIRVTFVGNSRTALNQPTYPTPLPAAHLPTSSSTLYPDAAPALSLTAYTTLPFETGCAQSAIFPIVEPTAMIQVPPIKFGNPLPLESCTTTSPTRQPRETVHHHDIYQLQSYWMHILAAFTLVSSLSFVMGFYCCYRIYLCTTALSGIEDSDPSKVMPGIVPGK